MIVQAWREAYTLACLMTATAWLKQAAVAGQSRTEACMPEEPLTSAHSEKHPEVAGKNALKDLDMAVMMGGPRLQTYAHRMIKELMSEVASSESSKTARARPAEGIFHLRKLLSDHSSSVVKGSNTPGIGPFAAKEYLAVVFLPARTRILIWGSRAQLNPQQALCSCSQALWEVFCLSPLSSALFIRAKVSL